MIHICLYCKKQFERKRSIVKFCSRRCTGDHKFSQPFICKIHGKLPDVKIYTRQETKWRSCNICRLNQIKKWQQENKEKVNTTKRKYNKKVENKEYRRQLENKRVNDLYDSYIKRRLTKESTLSANDITQELIEVKRIHLKLKRKIKELTNVDK